MVEGCVDLPLMAPVTLVLVNLALAGFSATTATAAGYGLAGSVPPADPAGRALEATQQALLPIMCPHAPLVLPRGLGHLDRGADGVPQADQFVGQP